MELSFNLTNHFFSLVGRRAISRQRFGVVDKIATMVSSFLRSLEVSSPKNI